jgi:F-type H+-transporting ATPase subunit delta
MLDPVTTRYAEALFNVARAGHALDAVKRDVERIAEGVVGPRGAALFDARLPLSGRRAAAEALLGGAHELTRRFVALLFEKRREEVLRHLGLAFHRRWLQERNAAEGVVESARPVGAGEMAELARAMGARLAKEVALTNKIVPELLGGVRVTVENRMIDASMRGRLEGLKKRLYDAPLPLARS